MKTEPVQIILQCKVIPPSHWGNFTPRVVFDCFGWWGHWENEIYFCIHGEKLRWTCDDCAEFMEEHEKKWKKPKKKNSRSPGKT